MTETLSRTVTASAVVLDGLTRTYRSRGGDVHALRAVSHSFAAGTFTAVMGPSGSGKSTLLHLAGGLDRPTSGRVVLAGTDITGLSEAALTRLRSRTMGFVFQSYNLLDALTVFDNVALPVRLAGGKASRPDVLRALGQVGLADLARRRPPELSGGQQQRVAIARALHARPAVVLADEPTGALDRRTGHQVLGLLRALVDVHGQTIVMVTHDPVAAAYADSVLFLADGRVVGEAAGADANGIAATMTELEQ